MKRAIIFLAVFAVLVTGIYSASADTLARDAMVTYSGTSAFSRLSPSERQACVDWLVHGGEMSKKCSEAVMKLVSYAPDAVTPEQRQALIAEASGETYTEAPAQAAKISKQEDNTGKYIAIGVLGVIAGLIIHNNVGSSRRSEPSYKPAPPKPAPHGHTPPHVDRKPPQASRPPVRQNQPPRQVSRPIDKRPPHK